MNNHKDTTMISFSDSHIFFCGLGGAGMIALAVLARHYGAEVSGTDARESGVLKARKAGFTCYETHTSENVECADVFVYSSAIKEDNPEWKRAREKNIPCIHRATLLAMMTERKKAMTIAGTHGKTTTTALSAMMLDAADMDPTAMVGGEVPAFQGNARTGNGEWFVTETDESDGSFTKFTSNIGVILNVDQDHLDHYGSFESLCNAFKKYAEKIVPNGLLVYNCDDLYAHAVAMQCTRATVRCSMLKKADIYVTDIKEEKWCTHFTLHTTNETIELTLGVPGRHNVMNAMCAAAAALHAGADAEAIQKACAAFHGVRRRFERIGSYNGADVIDDYAHHPREIEATTAAAHQLGTRVVTILEPHRYSRTRALREEFANACEHLNPLCVTRIFAASENGGNETEKEVFNSIARKNSHAVFAGDMSEARHFVDRTVQPGDTIICMGAGNISQFAHELVQPH